MEEERCLENGVKKIVVTKNHGVKKTRFRMEGPDGGWAWAVAFAACIISFIMAGLGRMSGILYVAFIETFHVDRMAASTPFSVRSSTRNLLGPVVGILGQKYGVRAVTITGGVLATLSASACFFAPDIIGITILWGVLNGIGTALTVTLPQVVIGQYFIKHTTTASGMAFSGGCVGSFVFPVLLETLLFNYGMQGTFLVIGAIIMHTIPAAMVLKTPPWLHKKHITLALGDSEGADSPLMESKRESLGTQKDKDSKIVENGNDRKSFDDCGINNDSNPKIDEIYPDIQFLRKNNELVLKILTMKFLGDSYGSEINQNELSEKTSILDEMEDLYRFLETSSKKSQFHRKLKTNKAKLYLDIIKNDHLKPPCSQKSQSFLLDRHLEFGLSDVPKTNSVPDFLRVRSQNQVLIKLKKLRNMNLDISKTFSEESRCDAKTVIIELKNLYSAHCILTNPIKGSYLTLSGVTTLDALTSDAGINEESDTHPNTFRDHIKTAMKLHRKPLFLLICLCRAVHFITLVPVMTVVVDFVMDKGLPENDGKYAIAALSLGDLLGRLCFGWVTDRGYMGLAKYMMVVMILQGTSTVSLPFMNTRTTLFIMIAVFGLLQGSLFVRHNVLVSKYMEDHEQSIAMGCINFFSGILGFGLPAYIGYFRDTIGTYDYIFYINGSLGILTGFLWILEPYFRKCSAPEACADIECPESV